VCNVSLIVGRREVVGLVGESGCGKSTLGRLIAGLIAPSAGRITVSGKSRTEPSVAQRHHWARAVQMVFQNPYASLNPRQTIREILEEPLRVHRVIPRSQIGAHAAHLLARVGLDASFLNRRPHQLSGGQCQRVGIARALSVEPSVLVCDEPVSALDVSIQAQILNLFADLRETGNVAYLFISHDLGVVERLCDRVAVMYLGRLVEVASNRTLFEAPKHPYTQVLLAAVPRIGRPRKDNVVISGERPSPLNPPSGCHLHPRCPHAMQRCREISPELREIAPGQFAACHLYG
jgi:peptide/nickel transport system ATP-binding protein